MADFDRTFPPPLAALLAIGFDYNDGNGMDFEPASELQSASENQSWIRAWTGNRTLDGAQYRFFGSDGTGGLAGFWLVRPGDPLLDQPVVYFDSEGDKGVIARNFADLAWILAGGIGPYEALSYPTIERTPHAAFTAFAMVHAPGHEATPAALVAAAGAEFPTFVADIDALCR